MEAPQTHETLLVTPRELFLAIRYSDVEKVRTLLDNGADANWRNRRGDESAVTYAALMEIAPSTVCCWNTALLKLATIFSGRLSMGAM